MKSFRRNMKAISPVLAVLMMIAVAIAGSLITYAWVTGYIGFTTEKAGQAIMVQSMAYNEGDEVLFVYVQNVGEGTVELDPTSCIYINGALETPSDITPDVVLAEKSTATIVLPYTVATGQKITAKVTTTLGSFTEKSTYPTSTTGGGGYVPPEPTPPTVTRVQATTTGFGSATAGNFLVVIAGHRSNNPYDYHAPTIAGWETQEVAWYMTDGTNDDRRIVAIFTKIATGGEDDVTVTWGDGSSSVFEIYQEFTGATSYAYVDSGVNSEGHRVNVWATSPMSIPSSALSDPGDENILSIGAAVWRDGGGTVPGPDISSVDFSGLDYQISAGLGTNTCPGVSEFYYGTAVTQTTLTWTDNQDMVSGLLVQFACSD